MEQLDLNLYGAAAAPAERVRTTPAITPEPGPELDERDRVYPCCSMPCGPRDAPRAPGSFPHARDCPNPNITEGFVRADLTAGLKRALRESARDSV